MDTDEYEILMRRIVVSLNRIDGIYYRFAKMSAVKDSTLVLLYALHDGKPHSQKQICDEWLIPKTTLNTIVKELTAEGILVLIREDGKKEKTLSLTEKGKKFACDALGRSIEAEKSALEKTLAVYSPEVVGALEMFADKFEEEFSRLLK